ncbi:MAG: hypothetical protein BWX90_01329 [bacterium ADurb.Bin132]|nr:MAG: hypothetical protein BWX90_01329 [bacterium ADurb.Bin132]
MSYPPSGSQWATYSFVCPPSTSGFIIGCSLSLSIISYGVTFDFFHCSRLAPIPRETVSLLVYMIATPSILSASEPRISKVTPSPGFVPKRFVTSSSESWMVSLTESATCSAFTSLRMPALTRRGDWAPSAKMTSLQWRSPSGLPVRTPITFPVDSLSTSSTTVLFTIRTPASFALLAYQRSHFALWVVMTFGGSLKRSVL